MAREDDWKAHYQQVGASLLKDVGQLERRVKEWAKYGKRLEEQLPQARYDHIQAVAKYNDFYSKEGDKIDASIAQMEEKLKKPGISLTEKQGLTKAVADQEIRRDAWTQVVIDPKHKRIDAQDVEFNGHVYRADGTSKLQKGLSYQLGQAVDGVTHAATGYANKKYRALTSADVSHADKKALCQMAGKLGVGWGAGKMLTSPVRINRQPYGQMVDDAWGQATDFGTPEAGIKDICDRIMSENRSGVTDERLAAQGPLATRQTSTTKELFDQIIAGFQSGDPVQERLAQQAAYNSDSAQEMFKQGREMVDVQEQQQVLAQQQQQQELQQQALVHTRQGPSLHH